MYLNMIMGGARALGAKAKNKMYNFLHKENGDTNFISIVIILVIVMVVAALFIGFKDQIMGASKTAFSSFMGFFTGETPSKDTGYKLPGT